MARSVERSEVRVVHSGDRSSATAQTSGMERRAGIDATTVGAKRIWLGHVTALPGMKSDPHHHGDSESAWYVLKGHVRVYYGEDYGDYQDVGPGDFVFVPPYLPHIEANLSQEEAAELIIARAPDNIVVNLE